MEEPFEVDDPNWLIKFIIRRTLDLIALALAVELLALGYGVGFLIDTKLGTQILSDFLGVVGFIVGLFIFSFWIDIDRFIAYRKMSPEERRVFDLQDGISD